MKWDMPVWVIAIMLGAIWGLLEMMERKIDKLALPISTKVNNSASPTYTKVVFDTVPTTKEDLKWPPEGKLITIPEPGTYTLSTCSDCGGSFARRIVTSTNDVLYLVPLPFPAVHLCAETTERSR